MSTIEEWLLAIVCLTAGIQGCCLRNGNAADMLRIWTECSMYYSMLDMRRKPMPVLLVHAGIPSFLKHVPVLGDVLRNISVRAVKRLVEVRYDRGIIM